MNEVGYLFKPHGIMFHHFHDNNLHIKSQGSISASELDYLLDYYQRDYNILNAKEWYDKAINNALDKTDICITFDDALKSQYDVANPVLLKRGITAFWFVYTSPLKGVAEKIEIYRHFRSLCFKNIDDFYENLFKLAKEKEKELNCNISEVLNNFNPELYLVGFPFYTDNDKIFRYLRDKVLASNEYDNLMNIMLEEYNYDIEDNRQILWLTEENIKKLHSEENIIGLHSHTHLTTLNTLHYNEQLKEYQENQDIISSIINDRVFCVSYPCNSYNNETFDIMKKLNIKIGFRANMADGFDSIYEFPREDHANIVRRMQNENYCIYK